jgi:hypothetical protein
MSLITHASANLSTNIRAADEADLAIHNTIPIKLSSNDRLARWLRHISRHRLLPFLAAL